MHGRWLPDWASRAFQRSPAGRGSLNLSGRARADNFSKTLTSTPRREPVPRRRLPDGRPTMTSEVIDGRRRDADAGTMTTTALTHSPTSDITHPLARPFLLVDAATTSGNGVGYLLAGAWLADWFGAPEPLVRGIGVFLLAFGVGVALLATRRPIPRRAVLVLAELNILWVLASLGYAAFGGLTALGAGWAVVQALVVGAFAAGQLWLARTTSA